MKEKLEVLISCMNQKNAEVAENTNLHTPALMINQCNADRMETYQVNGYPVRLISTEERGLSNSRNMAIANAVGTIGLIADDDEHLSDTYAETILNAYERFPDADIICFRMANQPSRLKQTEQKLTKWTALRIASWQITFRISSVKDHNLKFDPYLGAGSGNGASEEVKFLRDCIQAGLNAYYVPEDIGTVGNDYYETADGAASSWFRGFDQKFFYQRGIVNRYVYGLPVAVFYALYYTLTKRKMYGKYISMTDSFLWTMKGIIGNDIQKQKEADEKRKQG